MKKNTIIFSLMFLVVFGVFSNDVFAQTSPFNFAVDTSSITATSITLCWDTTPSVTNYKLTVIDTGFTTITQGNGGSCSTLGTDKSYQLSGLLPNTTYHFTLISCAVICGAGDPGSLPVFAFAPTLDIALYQSAPTLTVSGRTNDSITLSWNQITGADGYRLSMLTPTAQAVGASSPTYTFAGLTPQTTYSFQVQATQQGYINPGPASQVVYATTLPSSVIGGSASGFVANVTSDAAVSLSWSPVSGVAYYDITIVDSSGDPVGEYTYNPPQTTAIIGNLTPDTSYTFALIATDSSGSPIGSSSTAYATTFPLIGNGGPGNSVPSEGSNGGGGTVFVPQNCADPCMIDNPLGPGHKDILTLVCAVAAFIQQTLMPPIAVLMVLWASFLYLTAVGKPGNVISAKQVLVYTIIGAGVLILAPALIQLIIGIFGGGANGNSATSCTQLGSPTSLTAIFSSLINWFSWFLAILSVAAGIYSGFLYMTSSGDPRKATIAGQVLFYAVIGIAISILAFSILSIIKSFIVP